MRLDLIAALRQVRARAPRAKIVLIGYPEILPASGRCLKAGSSTVARARAELNRIATAQRKAARAAGVAFLDPRGVTRGHGLCTDDPWIAVASTATSQQFHPLVQEQQAIAAVLERLVGARTVSRD